MNKEEIQKLKDILWANTWNDEQIIREGIAMLKKYRKRGTNESK